MLSYYFSITEICPEILELIVKQLKIEWNYTESRVYHFIKIVIVHIKTQPGHILIIITDNL